MGDSTTSGAFREITCGICDRKNIAAVLAVSREAPLVEWVRCVGCGSGSVLNDGLQSPSTKPGESLEGLPEEVKAAHSEARACVGIGAYTSAEMMCRKILMHVAVDKGAGAGQTFAAYLSYLSDEGYTTPPMRAWVDVIRKHGNTAVHEIPPTDQERALGTLVFTEQLLRTVYVMEYLAQKFTP
ncbi:DUF4145 domain-containing protein [Streptomyces sp. NPDC006733]|uniref:DUF4145 domain-containing protein n=1 Tax=Streptomyces sp. NPDC006733 TaxID=3155460 RepID=UPI0033EFB99E